MGAGIFSTPLLHWLSAEHNRKLVTLESSEEYMGFARNFKTGKHEIQFVENWDKIDILNEHWSVVLVDHGIERRVIDTIRLKDNADYIILHDTEVGIYGYDKVWSHFKYIYHWKYEKPWTSVVSNLKTL